MSDDDMGKYRRDVLAHKSLSRFTDTFWRIHFLRAVVAVREFFGRGKGATE